MADIFISYASQDRRVAKKLADAFASYGWSVFWDNQIPIGKPWDREIESQLAEARCVVVLWSHESITHDWVRLEADDAVKRGVLVPITIEEGVEPPLRFRFTQTAKLIISDEHLEGIESTEAFTSVLPAIGALAPRTHLSGFWWMRSRESDSEIAVLRIAEAGVPGTMNLEAIAYRDARETERWISTAVWPGSGQGVVDFVWRGNRIDLEITELEGMGQLRFDTTSVPISSGLAFLAEVRVGQSRADGRRKMFSLNRCPDEETRCLIKADVSEVSALVQRRLAAKNAG